MMNSEQGFHIKPDQASCLCFYLLLEEEEEKEKPCHTSLPHGSAVGVGSPHVGPRCFTALLQSQVARQQPCWSTEVDLQRMLQGDRDF